MKERWMGLDYGTKTVGVAVSDVLGITAQGVETVTRKSNKKLRQTLAVRSPLTFPELDVHPCNFAESEWPPSSQCVLSCSHGALRLPAKFSLIPS